MATHPVTAAPTHRGRPYPPIGDYALLGDCHSAALVSRQGSIDWACFARIDAGSSFGRLLDWERGGYLSVAPTGPSEVAREYVRDTLVLKTTFRTDTGECTLHDCFTMHRGGARDPHHQLIRVVDGVRGSVELRYRIAPRFDYGEVRPWLRRQSPHCYTALGGNDGLLISGDLALTAVDDDLESTVTVRAGERVRLSVASVDPAEVDPDPPAPLSADEIDHRLSQTIAWWERWSARGTQSGLEGGDVLRSAIVLKALTCADTGAIVAAPTTSLPEAMGGVRNWDYRYSWIRDSQFTVRCLGELGFDTEADGFRRFIERTAAGNADGVQTLYGVRGERRLLEAELDHLEGYRGSAPVRVGNAARTQLQLDVYGYLLELAWRWHDHGHSPDDDYWRFLVKLADAAASRWMEPDAGIWELRGEGRHFVHSKAMCWVAVNRGIQLAEQCMRKAPVRRWRNARDEIRDAVMTRGWSDDRKAFVQTFDGEDLDAALLLLPSFEFIDYDDDRMVSTTDAVWRELDTGGGLLRRYRADDGIEGDEGAFVACSFWLVECLARQGRVQDARPVFDRAVATGNELGLFSEQYDTEAAEMLGNFPQGITHFSHVAAALALHQQVNAAGECG